MTRSPRFYLQVFVVCFAALLLEISYTRIFSFKLFYYFAYMIIGFALLGLGSGGVAVAMSKRLREISEAKLVAVCCIAAGVSVGVGYLLVALVPTDALSLWSSTGQAFRFALICSALFATFFFVGVILSSIFGRHPDQVGRLYGVDLVGASLACAAAVPAMKLLDPPGVVFAAGAMFFLAALPLARQIARKWLAPSAALTGLYVLFAIVPSLLPAITADDLKYVHPAKLKPENILYTRWSPVFRLDVVKEPKFGEDRLVIGHDGMLGSTLHKFDGDLTKLSRLDRDPRYFPFAVTKTQPDVLVIGSAGGHELLASLYYGADSITGVELNPETVALLTTHFRDYTGRLAEHPKVKVINAEGRSFLGATDRKWDIVYFVAPDSYAAMNAAASGAFVLSESYLYTRQTITETLAHLNEGGVLCMQFGEFNYARKPNRTARYLATARDALGEMGITDFPKHVLVASTPDFIPLSTILLSKQPFTTEQVDAFIGTTQKMENGVVRHAHGRIREDGPVNSVIEMADAELGAYLETYAYDVSSVTDNRPFFWHFARLSDVIGQKHSTDRVMPDLEDAMGERVLLFMLVFAVAFAAVALLAPFVTIRHVWRELPFKLRSGVYFGCLGLGFLFFEIALIQKLTLFLGYPTYSLSVTLMAMLLFTGLGSLASESYLQRRNSVLVGLFACIAAVTAFYLFGMPPIVDAYVGSPLPLRIVITVASIAPLGFCLGAFMPIGLATVANHTRYKEEYVAWGWAVNGFFSVVSSVLTTLLSMSYGFDTVMVLALGLYALAVVTLRSLPATRFQ